MQHQTWSITLLTITAEQTLLCVFTFPPPEPVLAPSFHCRFSVFYFEKGNTVPRSSLSIHIQLMPVSLLTVLSSLGGSPARGSVFETAPPGNQRPCSPCRVRAGGRNAVETADWESNNGRQRPTKKKKRWPKIHLRLACSPLPSSTSPPWTKRQRRPPDRTLCWDRLHSTGEEEKDGAGEEDESSNHQRRHLDDGTSEIWQKGEKKVFCHTLPHIFLPVKPLPLGPSLSSSSELGWYSSFL